MTCPPALFALAMIGSCTQLGLTPLALAATTHEPLKFSARSITVTTVVPTVEPFETRDGQRHTVLVLRTEGLTVRGLCLSNAARTPLGTYVVRITSPELTSRTLDVAFDGISQVELLGLPLDTRQLTSLDTSPITTSGEPGLIDLQVGNRVANTTVRIRWLTSELFDLGDVTVEAGKSEPECF